MGIRTGSTSAIVGCVLHLFSASRAQEPRSVTVPVALDHNRMLVEAEIQRADGSWRRASLWVDTGNPDFFLSEELARDLGIEIPEGAAGAAGAAGAGLPPLDVPPPAGIRIGGMRLDFTSIRSRVMFEPRWLFSATHNDANLPSTVLSRYQVVLDYPRLQLTLAEPGSLIPRGERAAARVHPPTGIVQIDAVVDGDSLSLALDNGASYSFVSGDLIERLSARHPDWPRLTGTAGCANMWGWWPPAEETLTLMRLPGIRWGAVDLEHVGVVGVAAVAPNGPGLGAWYSRKTALPVDGFLGPNAYKTFRVEIDYAGQAVYFARAAVGDPHDMDLVGLTLRPEADGRYRVIGVATQNGVPAAAGVEPGDVLLEVDGLETRGATMGTVTDALRGRPGETRALRLERDGRSFEVAVRVKRLL